MLVCLRRGLSLLRQHPPRSRRPLPLPLPLLPRLARLLHFSPLHLSPAVAMGENSAAGKDAKGKAPAPAATVVPDEAYLETVTQKRVRLFQEIQARQAPERLNISGNSCGKAPAPAATVVPDEAYLETVMQKRVLLFQEIQARRALERLNIGGEPTNQRKAKSGYQPPWTLLRRYQVD